MTNSSLLTNLLPSTSYLLAYALPLLFLSLLLTFTGAFLTLDRTRSFPPDYDALHGSCKKQKFGWLLEGGVGGLAVGCVFGIHLSTFLALLVPAVSTSSALTPKSFLPVWILSAIITTFISGRWKYCALTFSGISGGTLVALSLCVIVHPSLSTRIILTAIILPILTIMTLLPHVHFRHAALRFAMSATGAFGVVLSIALLSHTLAWANVWERYWETNSLLWGTSKERGLSAAFCLFLLAGMVGDFLLSHMFGECPDEKWDHYLANYAANLPNRAGTFRPLQTFWDRFFGVQKSPDSAEVGFPHCKGMKISYDDVQTPFKLRQHITRPATDITAAVEFQISPACLKKGRSPFQSRHKEAVKFDQSYSSDEGEDFEDSHVKLRLSQRASNDGGDNIDSEKEKTTWDQIKKGLGGEMPEYSDLEEDVTEVRKGSNGDRDSLRGWSPGFLRTHQHASTTSSRTVVSSPHLLSLGAVPATPSLIKALDRVAVAHLAAFGSDARQSGPQPSKSDNPRSTDGLPMMVNDGEYKGDQWAGFWKDVRDKARN